MSVREINRYPELRTDRGVNRIIHYINTGNVPAGTQNILRYVQKYGPNSRFNVVNNDLFVQIDANHNIRVSRPTERDQIMQAIYNDEERGLGLGLGQFFRQVSSQSLNISKEDTDEFLKKQGNYQVLKPTFKQINKPIRSRGVNHIWSIDLIDMRAYNAIGNLQNKYIFSCVDLHSGKVWARAITNNKNDDDFPTLRDTFMDICNEAGTNPRIVKVDSEFAKGSIMTWFRQQNIKVIKSRSHVPTDNSVVERYNREIRKKIKSGFVRHNNLLWAPHLQTYVRNINNQKKIGENETPQEQWANGFNAPIPPAIPNAQIVQNRLQPRLTFRLRDIVRIQFYAINNKTRAREKNNIENKKNVVVFTPEVYKIFRLYGVGPTQQYALKKIHIPNVQPTATGQDEIIYNDDGFHYKRFYKSDLLKVGTRNVNNIIHSSLNPGTNASVLRRINKIEGHIDVV